MSESANTIHDPQIVMVMALSAPDLVKLFDLIAKMSAQIDDPDRIAAVRVEEKACCAQLDVAARPVSAKQLH